MENIDGKSKKESKLKGFIEKKKEGVQEHYLTALSALEKKYSL